MEWKAKEPCVVTGKEAEYHHLFSRAARRDLSNEPWNMLPCCREIHSGFHARGTSFMANKYPAIRLWLLNNGWVYDSFVNKWTNERAKHGNTKKILGAIKKTNI